MKRSRDSLASVVTRLRIGRRGVGGSNSGKSKKFFSSLKPLDRLWEHTASYSIGAEVLSQGYSSRGVKLTSHCHLVRRLRMDGTESLLPLYAFTTWTRTTLPLLLPLLKNYVFLKW
jgi:hypothetical protein